MEVAPLLTPTERTLRSRLAAHQSWAMTPDVSARTAPGRAAFLARFDDEVDPDRSLPEVERQRRAEHARRAYFARLAFAAAMARRQRRAS